MKEISEMKKRALLAKQRLKLGYWDKMEQNRDKMSESVATVTVSEVIREKFKRDERLALEKEKALEEENLYKKVCAILDENPDETAPIGRLIDKMVYASLDEGGRQRYILTLAEKFRELERRYYLEKSTQGAR
ncbi:MAG: hypothetical protein IKC64_04970 [Clostridia bacterium]|nr:hypothetical protein [Clostridia bacterium]